MSFKQKILNKSNSYVYYKQSYEDSEIKINQLTNEVNFNKKYIDFMNEDLKNKRNEINSLQEDIELKGKSINFLENENAIKTELISKLDGILGDYEDLIEIFEKRYKSDFHGEDKQLKNINIAYVLRSFPIHSETFIISEVKWLKENGYNVVVFTNAESYKPVTLDFFVKSERFNSIIDLEKLLVKYEIDLIHTHFVYPTCTNFTLPVAEKLGIPFTVFAHAYDIFVNENQQRNKIDEISHSKYCKAIFTLSNFHKDFLLERGVDENKIVITKQATSYELSEIEIKNNEFKHIISISRFVEKKGLDVLINAAKLLEDKNYEFSIYGFGYLEDDLKQQIEDLDCKNISIKGELSHDKVKNILMESDLLVSPCKVAKNGDMDGFPTIIFESMARGLPILTTDVSAIPEIIEDGVNGFIVEQNNPELFAQKIVEISELSNDELFKIRKQAQNDVKNISSVEKTMEKYMETLKF